MSRYNFKFGDNWISELGVISTETPPIEIAERDCSMVDIPGRDGSDYIDNGRYLNVEFTREVSLIGRKNFPVEEKAARFVNSFAYLHGYHTFEDTDHNDMYTEAVLMNLAEVNRDMRTLNTAKLKFSRKPYWYLKSGQEMVSYTREEGYAGVSLFNPFGASALPYFKFKLLTTGAMSGTIAVQVTTTLDGVRITKDFSYTFNWGEKYCYFVIDVENRRITVENNQGRVLKYVDGEVPCELGPTKSIIKLTSSNPVETMSIAPRWRCL